MKSTHTFNRHGLAAILMTLTLIACTAPPAHAAEGVEMSGEQRVWHPITLTFQGPETRETAEPNPFRDYRLTVTFKHAGSSLSIPRPGFFAADGNAAETGATAGNRWRVRFTPPATGEWTWVATFRRGEDVALREAKDVGRPGALDGLSGSFTAKPTDKTGRDFRHKGLLQNAGNHYLRFAGTGDYYLKGGADSPENFLGYADFDGTRSLRGDKKKREGEAARGPLHHYKPHVRDWNEGDPTWQDGKGKGIIGALNYLASEGMNSVYFLTMNVGGGDGMDVWPWTAPDEHNRFDVSKLAQWEIVFRHMMRRGIQMHVITQETENDQYLDGGELGPERKLYYRELIARFAHHPALTWNLGEENTNTTAQRKAFAEYIRLLDGYNHPIVVHTYPNRKDEIYEPLLGYEKFTGPSLQFSGNWSEIHPIVKKWVQRSAEADWPWVVMVDEPGTAGRGTDHDAREPNNQPTARAEALWGALLAGGSGVEWYFGYRNPHNDLNCEDWRSRDRLWDYTRHALTFFQEHLPFTEMDSADGLTTNDAAYCFAKPGEVYAVYLPPNRRTKLKLPDGNFSVRWYDPRNGGELQTGSTRQITGPGMTPVGDPPATPDKDWVVLIRQIESE